MRRAAAAAALALLSALGIASAAPSRPVLRQGLEYARPGGTALLLDAYLPREPGPHPAVVVVHGGGWREGSRSDVAFEGLWFADRGYAAFVIDYRLAPRHPFPAALRDAQAAVRWIRRHAGRFDVDPERIAAFGGSAGGHIAAMLAVGGSGSREAGSRVRVAVAWSSPMDLARTISDAPAAYRARVRAMVEGFLGCRVEACGDLLSRASPIAHVDETDGAVFLANSRDEVQSLAQAEAMAVRLESAGVPFELAAVRGSAHAEGYTFGHLDGSADTVINATFRFIGTWIGDTRKGLSAVPVSGPSPLVTAFVMVSLVAGIPGLSVGLGRAWSQARARRLSPFSPPPDRATLARIEALQRVGVSQGEIAARLSLEGFV